MPEKARGSLILPVKNGFLLLQMLSVGKLGLSKCLSSDCEALQILGPGVSIAERNSFPTLEPISPPELRRSNGAWYDGCDLGLPEVSSEIRVHSENAVLAQFSVTLLSWPWLLRNKRKRKKDKNNLNKRDRQVILLCSLAQMLARLDSKALTMCVLYKKVTFNRCNLGMFFCHEILRPCLLWLTYNK